MSGVKDRTARIISVLISSIHRSRISIVSSKQAVGSFFEFHRYILETRFPKVEARDKSFVRNFDAAYVGEANA